MSNLKRPLTKNFYLSLTGKEPVHNNFTLYNNFPIGLMIISILDPASCRGKEDFNLNDNDEVEIKIKYMNQQASDLFEIKENDSISKIHQQLKQFKKFDHIKTSEENLDSILFYKCRENEYYGSFKNQASLIYVKYKMINDDLYICTDYYTDEKKCIQNQLFQSLKFQYIATIFHELYNPINALLFMIDTNQNEEENKDEILKSNLGNQNNISDMEESQFSLMTENDYDKSNSNLVDNENNSNIKNRKIDDFYKSKLSAINEKEKDISLLVNMIYIFLQNLILYLRINLGLNINYNENQQKKQNNITNDNCEDDKNSKGKKESKQEEEEKNNEINNKKNDNIYSDNYLTCINKNKKVNLELSFYKYLNKFSYLFNFKNIQYCNDFSYLSDKYIFTDESVFFDFLGQIYSFLYYVVPKSQGFEISYSIINDNKLKILFHKTNFLNKGGYRIKKIRKNNSILICEDKFKATSTVKTSEMTQEILYKLSEILGIKLKIMEYEDQKEDKYLTIILPFFIDDDNDSLDLDIDELSENNFGKIPQLAEVVARNILYDNNIEKSENEENEIKNINENINIEKKKTEKNSKTEKNILRNKNNNKYSKHNPNYLNPNFYKFTPERKASFLVEEVEERNSSEEDVSSEKEVSKEKEKDNENENNQNKYNNNSNNNINNSNINNSNINNSNINNSNNNNNNNNSNINNNNNYNIKCSSISKSSVNNGGCISIISNSQKLSLYKSKSPMSDKNFTHLKISNFKDLSNNYLHEVNPFIIQNDTNISKDVMSKETPNIRANTNIKLNRNPLTLIHQKYSSIERLKACGVEILKEKDSQNINDNKNKPFCLESVDSSDDNTSKKDKKSICAEVDSDNFFEIENENEYEEDIENGFNNHQRIENDNNHGIIKHNNSFLININYINNNVFLNESPKNNKMKLLSNKPSNKTLDYNNKSSKNNIFTPEIKDNFRKRDSKISKIKKKNSTVIAPKCGCKDILLVDDDEFILKTSKNILKAFKLEADCAENGQECLNKIKEKQEKNCKCLKSKYKIILMDITMPVMDGIEAAKNIQKLIDENKLYDTLKIIFISAHVNLDLTNILSGIKCAIDYYAKPISGDKYKSLLDKYYYSK